MMMGMGMGMGMGPGPGMIPGAMRGRTSAAMAPPPMVQRQGTMAEWGVDPSAASRGFHHAASTFDDHHGAAASSAYSASSSAAAAAAAAGFAAGVAAAAAAAATGGGGGVLVSESAIRQGSAEDYSHHIQHPHSLSMAGGAIGGVNASAMAQRSNSARGGAVGRVGGPAGGGVGAGVMRVGGGGPPPSMLPPGTYGSSAAVAASSSIPAPIEGEAGLAHLGGITHFGSNELPRLHVPAVPTSSREQQGNVDSPHHGDGFPESPLVHGTSTRSSAATSYHHMAVRRTSGGEVMVANDAASFAYGRMGTGHSTSSSRQSTGTSASFPTATSSSSSAAGAAAAAAAAGGGGGGGGAHYLHPQLDGTEDDGGGPLPTPLATGGNHP